MASQGVCSACSKAIGILMNYFDLRARNKILCLFYKQTEKRGMR